MLAMVAIKAATLELIKYVRFFVDSQAARKALVRHEIKSKLVHKTITAPPNEDAVGRRIILNLTKAHTYWYCGKQNSRSSV